MKIYKKDIVKLVEIINQFNNTLGEKDFISTENMSIHHIKTGVVSDDIHRFQIKVTKKNLNELQKLVGDFPNNFPRVSGYNLMENYYVRNKHNNRLWTFYDYKKFKETKEVTIEEVKEYLRQHGK